jgi:uncharacterized protein
MNEITIICSALLGLLLFGLGIAVSMCRAKTDAGFGFPDDPTHFLTKMVRAHSNTAEFAPFLAVLFLYFGAHNPSTVIISLIIGATVCRFLIVFGLLTGATLSKPNVPRFIGALGTYLFGSALCLCLLI